MFHILACSWLQLHPQTSKAKTRKKKEEKIHTVARLFVFVFALSNCGCALPLTGREQQSLLMGRCRYRLYESRSLSPTFTVVLLARAVASRPTTSYQSCNDSLAKGGERRLDKYDDIRLECVLLPMNHCCSCKRSNRSMHLMSLLVIIIHGRRNLQTICASDLSDHDHRSILH